MEPVAGAELTIEIAGVMATVNAPDAILPSASVAVMLAE
jgi:hypothetical protein